MFFNSLEFIIFYAVVFTLIFLVSPKWRWLLLLLAGYYFYASWELAYLGLIIISTLTDYIVALRISVSKTENQKRFYLGISITVNLLILFIFKYYDFFVGSFATLLNNLQIPVNPQFLSVLLPVGISFYTFQTMAYTIDVYKGEVEPETHLGIFALYVSFFPQLVAGPIERAQKLLPQLRNTFQPNSDNIYAGLQSALWGFFLKMVVADNLASYVDLVYGDVSSYHGFALLVATLFFTFQIYCDFAGYSYIAIGIARMLNVDLMTNFSQPYLSKSIPEFWQRWHISLSTWFRDYVYIPLGGNRVVLHRNLINLAIVFLVSGLWHGASWTFVIWGAWHALFMIVAVLIRTKFRPKAKVIQSNFIQWIITFILVYIGWIFFRANSIEDAFYVIQNMLVQITAHDIVQVLKDQHLGFLLIAFLFTCEFLYQYQYQRDLDRVSASIRFVGYIALLLMIFNLSAVQQVPFIYFQF